jgi:hypothetical protein
MKFPTIIAVLISPEWQDFFIMLGAIVLAALAAAVCAFFFRKKHRRHHRRRRRERRSLNPTLAQTGGLPPVRQPQNPPDQPKS